VLTETTRTRNTTGCSGGRPRAERRSPSLGWGDQVGDAEGGRDGRHTRLVDNSSPLVRRRRFWRTGIWQVIGVVATVLALLVAAFGAGQAESRNVLADSWDERDSAIRQRDEAVASLESTTRQFAVTSRELQKAQAKIRELEDELKPRKLEERTAMLRLRLHMDYKPPQQTWDLAEWDVGTEKTIDFFVEQRGSQLTFMPYAPLGATAAVVEAASLANVSHCTSATSYSREPIRLERGTNICLRNPRQSLALFHVQNLQMVRLPALTGRATTVEFRVTVRRL
jgi:hypothetical protein